MTILALVNGILFRPPQQRTAKTGRLFVTATIRVKPFDNSLGGDGSRFIRVVAFSESVQSELMRLQDGDALSAQGQLSAEVFEKDGEHRVSLSLVADQVLALRQPPRQRKPKATPPEERSRQARLAGSWSAASGDFNDSIDFGGEP